MRFAHRVDTQITKRKQQTTMPTITQIPCGGGIKCLWYLIVALGACVCIYSIELQNVHTKMYPLTQQ